MWALWFGLALGGTIGAGHEGIVAGDVVTWRSTVSFDRPTMEVTLAAPLPPGTVVEGATPVAHDGAVVALRFPKTMALSVRTVDPAGDGLHPPIPRGPALQRVVLDGAALRADPALGLERRVRYTGPPGLERRARRGLDRILGERVRARDQAVYVTGDRVAAAGGLRGTLGDVRGRASRAAWAAAALFAAALMALWAVYRGLDRAARREAAEAYIERELGGGSGG